MDRKRHPIPPPPSPDVEIMTPIETAGLLRIRERRFEDLRREDATFPKPYRIGEQLRWRRADVLAWFGRLQQGWSRRGTWNRRVS